MAKRVGEITKNVNLHDSLLHPNRLALARFVDIFQFLHFHLTKIFMFFFFLLTHYGPQSACIILSRWIWRNALF